MKVLQLAALLAVTACAPETTSFRTTDRGDAGDRDGPPAAAYLVHDVARVHVWSNGGYIGTSDEPMTHVGFEIVNTSGRPITFDSDALALVLLDKRGAPLPPAAFTAVTPLGPARVSVAGRATTTLDVYFSLPVRPRVVDTMRVQWSLEIGDARYDQTTSFVRDDDYPVVDPPAPQEPTRKSS